MPIDDRNIDPGTIANHIVARNILDKKSINDALELYLSKKIEQGFSAYSFSANGKTLELKDEKDNLQRAFDLPVKIKKSTLTDNVLVLDENAFDYKKVINLEKYKGLFSNNKGGFLKTKKSFYLLNNLSANNISLYVPEKLNYIFLTDDESGKLFIISPDLKKVLKEIDISANSKINLTSSAKPAKIYLTDSKSANIFTLNLDNYNLEKTSTAYGSLGNLVVSKDDKFLYVISTENDKTVLLLLSTTGFKLAKKIAIKGKLFSKENHKDLVTISPDKKHIYVMTYIDKPEAFTPLITVISTDNNEVVHQMPLTPNDKPVGISFRANLGIPETAPSFSQLLVEKRLMHESNMEKVLDELHVTKEVKKEYKETTLLDQDVFELQGEIEKQLKGKEKDLTELLEVTQSDINSLMGDTGIDWQGRKMSKEDKESLINKMATLNGNPEVSKTNGVFVLSWMSDLLEP